MKKALHVKSGQLVDASNVSHTDYEGIFLCPTCKAVLKYRGGYTTSNGRKNSPAFVHPSGGTQEQQDCKERIDLEIIENPNQKISEIVKSKKQFYVLLRKKLLQALRRNSKSYAISYYKQHMPLKLNELEVFLKLSNLILSFRNNGGSILARRHLIKEAVKTQRDNLYLGIGDSSHPSLSIYKISIKEEDLEGHEADSLINRYVNRVIWFLEFLNASDDENLRHEALDLVFGGLLEEGMVKDLPGYKWNAQELESIGIVFTSQELTFEFYKNLNTKSNISLHKLSLKQFENASEFHNYLFDSLANYFIGFKWSYLFRY